MHIFKYQKMPSITGRSTRHVGGFVHLPLLIAGALLVPLTYLLWPAVTATTNTVTSIVNTLAMIIPVCIWIVTVGVALYLIRLVWKRKYLAKLRDYWR